MKCLSCGKSLKKRAGPGRPKSFCPKCVKSRRADYYKRWYSRNGRRRSSRDKIRLMEWKKQNPQKLKAHEIVARAISRGELKNPGFCKDCGEETNYLDAHHEDYSRPLVVVWLCPKCHKKRHIKG